MTVYTVTSLDETSGELSTRCHLCLCGAWRDWSEKRKAGLRVILDLHEWAE